MTDLEDILLDTFEELRQRRVPLGLSDYIVALQAVNDLTDVEDLEIIKNLCRLFWAKSFEDQLLFNETFDIHVNRHQAIPKRESHHKPSPELKPHLPPQPHIPKSNQSLPTKRQESKPPLLIPRTPPSSTSMINPRSLRYKHTAKYHLTPRPPMDKRDMASIWRKLRRPQREGFSEDLDIQATTENLAHTGFLFKPVLQYRRRNQAKLVIMIDQDGSMEPFTLLMDAVLDSIQRSGSLRHIQIFYFHDTPEDYLYMFPTLLGARSLDSILTEYCQNTSVLLISDAGAARGHYDSSRIQATKEFVDKLSQYTYLYTWLNPVPKARWTNTTAWYIAQLLPMFQLDWEGLNDTVNILRGQSLTGA
jgi:uncharacterized protein with von Willebrand factor type A (vWA) domain